MSEKLSTYSKVPVFKWQKRPQKNDRLKKAIASFLDKYLLSLNSVSDVFTVNNEEREARGVLTIFYGSKKDKVASVC